MVTDAYISSLGYLWLRLSVWKNKINCCLLWISSRGLSTHLFSEETLKPNYVQALDLNKPIVILGDFNCDMSKATSSKYKALSKFISEMNLLQLIKSPTRITDTTSTLLDIILLSSSSIVSKQRRP